MKIRAMIFDMDGVLTSSSDEHFAAWRILASDLGFDLPDELEVLTKGVSRMDSLEIILKHGQMQDEFTYEQKNELASSKNEIYMDMISKFTASDLLPGAVQLLEVCKAGNIKVALASASKNGPILMERLGITHYFDYVVNPAEIAHGKPAPDIFLKAAGELGVNPRFCAGIEDAVAGIRSIKAAGMIAVGIGDTDELSEADIVYPDCSVVDLLEINRIML
ncbi:MAG: beta-phosphoglucomutase [Clostridia bacterium]|nr:beta-phosphoglucomutase [Clostridia bacterium]MBN2883048.1 beta-phosphoglucomutase [Clostridia bacterium]